jgi:AraC family transcriptional regulator
VTIWTPEDVTPVLDNVPIVSSLGTAPWEGIVVEKRSVPPNEVHLDYQTHHLLALSLGEPFRFCYQIGGKIKEGQRFPGSTNLLPVGLPINWRWEGTADSLYLYLGQEFLARVADPYLVNPDRLEILCHSLILDPQIEHIGKTLLAELEQGAPGGKLFGESLATALAVHLLRHYSAFPATILDITRKLIRTEMRRALEYVHDNLDRDLALQEIATVSGVSANYLTALFKQTTGYSLHQYVIRQRVEKARTLLRRSDLSIGEIAHRVGFYDSSHLNRHFKRLLGITPRTLREES